jgi:hypothetical protein
LKRGGQSDGHGGDERQKSRNCNGAEYDPTIKKLTSVHGYLFILICSRWRHFDKLSASLAAEDGGSSNLFVFQ